MSIEATQALLPMLAAGELMEGLRQDLHDELSSHEQAEVRGLAATLREIRTTDAINVVLVGQHDAGKSLLVRGLTGRDDIPVGAGPLTDRSTAYEWSGHRLVDTPGVQAGVRADHDAIADEALSAADVVLFVLTVEGLDDVITRYFLQVRRELRSLRALVIVVNKSLSERNDRSVSEADIARTIGPAYDAVPVVWTDAWRWANAATSKDPEQARRDSGLRELGETVTDLLHSRGTTLRLLTPLRAWSDRAQQALRLLAQQASGRDDLGELDALGAHLDAQQVEAADSVDRRAGEAQALLVATLRRAGPDLEKPELEALVQQAADVFDDRIAADGEQRDEALLAQVAVPQDAGLPALPRLDARALLQESLQNVARTFSGMGARPGGTGHTMVSEAWHALGGKFKPWGAVNTSRAIGRAASRANVAITVGAIGWEVYSEWGAARARANDLRRLDRWNSEAVKVASEIVDDWRQAAQASLDELHDARLGELARRRLEMLLRLTQADEVAQRLAALDRRCENLIAELTGSSRAGK